MENAIHNSSNMPITGTIVYRRQTINIDPEKRTKARMSDTDIYNKSVGAAVNQYNESPFRYINTAILMGLPAVHSVTVGALKGNTTAQKSKVALNTLKGWGVFMLAAYAFDKAAFALINKVPSLREFRKDHPTTTSLGVLLGGIIAGGSAIDPANKLLSKIAETKTMSKAQEGMVNLLKKSPLNKEGVKNFMEKTLFNPAKKAFGAEKGQKAFTIGAYGLFLGMLAVHSFEINRAKKTQQQTQKELLAERKNARHNSVQSIVIEQAGLRFNETEV